MQMSKLLFTVIFCLLPVFRIAAQADSSSVEFHRIDIREWPVPFHGQPRDPFAHNEDEIWFVGQAGHYLGRFKPSTEEFFKQDLQDRAGPHNLIVSAAGMVWYSGNLKGYIGRYDPRREELTRIEMPDDLAKDPHTLVFDRNEQHIWFTVQWGNFIGRLTLADSSVQLIPVPVLRARPYGIKIAPDGTVWVALLGTNKLARVEPETLKLRLIDIPNRDARPRRLEVTDDGRVWYADYGAGALALFDPNTESFREWPLPGGKNARPYGTALDKSGRVWVVTGTQPNYFVGFDTSTEAIISITAIPSGAGTVRHMHYHAPTDSIWFGTDTQNIGRAIVSSENPPAIR